MTHWKRLCCWEGLGAGWEGDDRGWDGWMASLTRWTWIWVNSGSGDRQGGLACWNSWGRKESDMTEQLHFLFQWKLVKARVVGDGNSLYFPLNFSINLKLLSVQFSHSVVSDSLWPHELQHTRPPYPSPTSGVHSDSCPSSQWCHPAISSWVVPFSSCPQSLPASKSFPMSQLFTWGGQSTGVSALVQYMSVYFFKGIT